MEYKDTTIVSTTKLRAHTTWQLDIQEDISLLALGSRIYFQNESCECSTWVVRSSERSG